MPKDKILFSKDIQRANAFVHPQDSSGSVIATILVAYDRTQDLFMLEYKMIEGLNGVLLGRTANDLRAPVKELSDIFEGRTAQVGAPLERYLMKELRQTELLVSRYGFNLRAPADQPLACRITP